MTNWEKQAVNEITDREAEIDRLRLQADRLEKWLEQLSDGFLKSIFDSYLDDLNAVIAEMLNEVEGHD